MSDINYSANFDGVELTSVEGLTILATNPYVPAKRSLTLSQLARTNKAKVSGAFYNKRDLLVRVSINRATRDLLEQSIDSLMLLLQGLEKDLILRQSNTQRKYIASYSDSIVKADGGSHIEIDLIFVTSDHFGYDISSSLLTQITNFTSGNKTETIQVGGTAPFQLPVITLTYSAIGSTADSRNVTIGNGALGMAVSITRTWTNGDVIAISAVDGTVKVNGVNVTYTGAIPEFAPGVGYLTYNDTFTSRTFSATVTYTKRYI